MNNEFNQKRSAAAESEERSKLYLLSFTNKEGKPCWALLEVSAEKENDFLRAYDEKRDVDSYVENLIEGEKGERSPSPEKLEELRGLHSDRFVYLPAATEKRGPPEADPPANDL